MEPARTTLTTTRTGLDYDTVPMRLWAKAKRLGIWDPAAVDLSQDQADWAQLSERERDLLVRLTAQFAGGEESVAYDLLPLLSYMAERGRIEDELFLTSYLWEEGKHVEAFGRFLHEVAGARGGLEGYFTEAYKQHFFVEQPRAMNRLRTDAAPEALAEAVVTYQMITEGVLAETGYHAYYTVLERAGILPGMQTLVQHIQRDEARHVGYGIYLLSRLVAEHDSTIWPVIEQRLQQLIPLALEHISQTLAPYGPDIPFGVVPDDFLAFGMSQFQKRVARIEKARSQSVDDVLYGRAAREEDAGDGAPVG